MNLNRLDLVSLSLFVQVARAGSISKGAEQANLAVGAASRRLTELEASLGTSVFERHSRGVVLSVAGAALQRHAERILDDVRQLTAEMSDYSRGVTGVVRLWTNTAALGQGLPKQLASFEAQNAVRIELQEQDSSTAVIALLDGRADLGIVAEGTPLLGLQAARYTEDRLVLAVPANHLLASRREVEFHEVVPFDFVGLPQDASLSRRLAFHASELGASLRIRFHVRSYDAMWHMVGAGLGLAMLPMAAARPFVGTDDVRIVSVSDGWALRKLLIAARDLTKLSRAERSLIEHLTQSVDDQAPAVSRQGPPSQSPSQRIE